MTGAQMQIAFPPEPPEYRGRDLVVAFSARVDGHGVPCAITAEALEDHFGARSLLERDLLVAFEAHWPAIEAMAARMLAEIGGRPVLLHSGHFRMAD
ncbi:DUF1488 domain-containing protein [Burkholderia vietnamiensis]|uniref:DUF1488 domain-containing protein n=1 Tax=Burkholderia vietnamiensis TaxID=60552 RepID=UPI001B9E93BC|nr:DUF1488 domain-containing protein [Burkholderia vietnamiensis]MBR8358266.1 DUF1488 domain-containing protein [Burkholderia vietnamiensis]